MIRTAILHRTVDRRRFSALASHHTSGPEAAEYSRVGARPPEAGRLRAGQDLRF